MNVTPAIFAWLGWRLDRWAGTSPLFLIFFFVFTFGYVVWRQFVLYDAKMSRQELELLGPKHDRGAS